MSLPLQPQQYDDLQKGALDIVTTLGRSGVEFAMQHYYRAMSNRPVKVEVRTPAREQVEQVRNALHEGASQDQLWKGVMDYGKQQNLNQQQQEDYEKYAGMILRHAQQDYAMDVAKPAPTLSKAPRQKL